MTIIKCTACNSLINKKPSEIRSTNFCNKKCMGVYKRKENKIIANYEYAEIALLTKGKVIKTKISLCDIEKISKIKWYAHFDTTINDYYFCGINRDTKKTERLHRYIMDCPPDLVVDHIDTYNHSDNRRENLRICTQLENMQNLKLRKNLSCHRYIYWNKDRQNWRFSIRVNGKVTTIASNKDMNNVIKIRDEFLKDTEKLKYG